MARKLKEINPSSITETAASAFLASADERATLWCEKIPGLHLIKLKSGGSWRYRYTDAIGKRRTATVGKFSNMKPAQAAQRALDWHHDEVDVLKVRTDRRSSAVDAQRLAEARTVGNYLDKHYQRHMERWHSTASARANYQRLRNHFVELLNRDMTTIDKADIDAWQERIEARGRSYQTIRRTFSALKTMLNTAVEDGVIDENPLDRVKLKAPKVADQQKEAADAGKRDRRMLTTAEIGGILAGLDLFAEEVRAKRRNSRAHGKPNLPDLDLVEYPHWFIPFCHLAMNTGLRPGDLYTLTWDELNIRFGRLTKQTSKSMGSLRKGKKPTVVDMALNQTVRRVMTGWHTQQGKPDAGLVFPSPITGLAMDKQAHNKAWRHVKQLGGLAPGLNFYCFRHHFISSLVAQGMPLLTVAKLAGHKSVKMIEEHYGHLCAEQAVQALDIIERTLTVARSETEAMRAV